jgi:hypothetical protein
MSQIITFENTLLANAGKRGSLKPMDSSGYYRMNAGGFNIPNRHGVTYPINDYLRECMREGSDLDRRIKEGQVYCELGHPPQYYLLLINGQVVRKPITELFEWINRLRTIDMDNVCGHIRKIHWIMESGDRGPVYNDVEIIPFGPKGEFLAQSLPNPDINTALSIRTVTKPQNFGDKERQVDYWSTYDAVIDQGIYRACKHLTAGLESLLEGYDPQDTASPVISTTFDELFFVCDQKLKNPAVVERYQGTESLDKVRAMLTDLKKRAPRKDQQVKLIATNSLGAFR